MRRVKFRVGGVEEMGYFLGFGLEGGSVVGLIEDKEGVVRLVLPVDFRFLEVGGWNRVEDILPKRDGWYLCRDVNCRDEVDGEDVFLNFSCKFDGGQWGTDVSEWREML